MTNEDLILLLKAIQQLKTSEQQLPIKVWYTLNKNEKAVRNQVRDFDEARIELAKQHAEKYEKDGNVRDDAIKAAKKIKDKAKREKRLEKAEKVEDKNYKKGDPKMGEDNQYVLKDRIKFNKELEDLLRTEVEVSLHKLNLEDCQDLNISGQENPHMGMFVEHCIKMDD